MCINIFFPLLFDKLLLHIVRLKNTNKKQVKVVGKETMHTSCKNWAGSFLVWRRNHLVERNALDVFVSSTIIN